MVLLLVQVITFPMQSNSNALLQKTAQHLYIITDQFAE